MSRNRNKKKRNKRRKPMTGLIPAAPTQPLQAGSNASVATTGDHAVQGRPEAVRNLRVGKQTRAEFQAYSGPLPHPDHFAAYELAVPGSGSRILAMAEKQSAHRQQLENTHLHGTLSAQKWGIVAATIIVLGISAGAIWLIHEGKSVEGLVALLGGIASLAGIFVYSSRRQVQDQAKKRAASGG